MIFNPTREQARRFFIDAWRKRRESVPASELETLAADWIALHPEYLDQMGDAGISTDYRVDGGQANPFLHMGMHLSIEEQVKVDQPAGIRQAVQLLAHRLGSMHDAHHAAMDCLGEMLWTAQRNNAAPDGETYVACVRRKAG
ncbi:DUF1841 family protein [soil metagenome]